MLNVAVVFFTFIWKDRSSVFLAALEPGEKANSSSFYHPLTFTPREAGDMVVVCTECKNLIMLFSDKVCTRKIKKGIAFSSSGAKPQLRSENYKFCANLVFITCSSNRIFEGATIYACVVVCITNGDCVWVLSLPFFEMCVTIHSFVCIIEENRTVFRVLSQMVTETDTIYMQVMSCMEGLWME